MRYHETNQAAYRRAVERYHETNQAAYRRAVEHYPFTIRNADGDIVDQAANVETVESILYGDIGSRDGRAWLVVAPDDQVDRIRSIARANADCWSIPVDIVMSDSSYRLGELARVLVNLLGDSCEGYPYVADTGVIRRGGRSFRVRLLDDQDAGIGRWLPRRADGSYSMHHDDFFGTFAWRETDRLYGYPAERPREFDGRAVVLRPRDHGARIGDPVWWQPPADVSDADMVALERDVRDFMETGSWSYVVVRVDVDGESEYLAGVPWGDRVVSDLVEHVADLLDALDALESPFVPSDVPGDVARVFGRLVAYVADDVGLPTAADDLAARGANAESILHVARLVREADPDDSALVDLADLLDNLANHYPAES